MHQTESWYSLAKSLHEGSSTRVNCLNDNCTDNRRSMKVQHSADGYSCYCFSCHFKRRKLHGERSISKLVASRNNKLFISQNKYVPTLPKDFTTEIPAKYAVWLYKAGIYKDTYIKYGIGWSQGMQRIILPVYKQDELIYLQARAVLHGMQPKYLNPSNSNSVYFKSLPSKYLITNKVIVITEDMLSAIRTGVYLTSYSLLGTVISDALAYKLSDYTCLIWLDPDKAGINGTRKVKKKLQSLGCKVYALSGTKDPKYYTNEELKEILHGYT